MMRIVGFLSIIILSWSCLSYLQDNQTLNIEICLTNKEVRRVAYSAFKVWPWLVTCGDIFISCQVGNKLRNLLLPHILWMLLFVEHDKSSNPLHIRLFSSDRIMLLSNYISDLF